MRLCVCLLIVSCLLQVDSARAGDDGTVSVSGVLTRYTRSWLDSVPTKKDTSSNLAVDTNKIQGERFLKSGIDPNRADIYPNVALQQMLKGRVAGLYVQEPSGEPGSEMSMLIRGTAIPYTGHADVYNAQPTVILDGVPLIMDNPFAFNIEEYDFNRIGPATNLLSAIDPSNIASIEVLKDFGDAAIYGPYAANGGVISIKTKAPVIGGRKISFNTYVGVVQRPQIFTTNARYENSFRQPFYDRYGGLDEITSYPLYLRDSTNDAYYGPSNWTDLYYKNKIIRGANASLSSGTDRANFRFAVGNQQTQNPGDNTKLDRYNAMFEINMVPVTWLTMSAMISAARLERVRNSSLRDRFAEVQYLPDLVSPLSPNKDEYASFIHDTKDGFDNNKSNEINGYFRLKFDFTHDIKFVSSFSFDYNEGLRDIFYPSTLMETVNYVSNYFGYNQRLSFNNTLTYHHNWNKKHDLVLQAGQVFDADFNRYNYNYAYNGPNDLIKVNLLNSDPNKSDYLTSKAFNRALIFMFMDKERARLLSFYGHATYSYGDALQFSVLLRGDGSSSAQPDDWWTLSPTFSGSWNIKNTWLKDNPAIDQFKLHASWGRVARLMTDDRFGEGPQYVPDLSFNNNPVKFSYTGFPGLSRPYSSGYVGYGIKWPYVDQLDIGTDMTLLHNRLNLSLDVYNKMDKNMLFNVPFMAEYGYSSEYKNGMEVRNRGVELTAAANVLPATSKLQWIPSFNIAYNQNTLMALPNGLKHLVIGSGPTARMLEVGHAIDQFWVLQNKGIYNKESQVPVNPSTGAKDTYEGTPLEAGDPIWVDQNGDHTIDDNDKVLKGHYLPQVTGGFSSDFVYKNFTFSFTLYYALGSTVQNENMANHLDFVNHEGVISMDAIKEITFWQKAGDYSRYPMYNPWSSVIPYRLDQDLFLENGSFMKLRNVSLQYNFTKARWWNKKSPIHGLSVYGTASNLLTFTPYSGRDPELIYYNGVDNGYGLPIPKTYTIGVKMDL